MKYKLFFSLLFSIFLIGAFHACSNDDILDDVTSPRLKSGSESGGTSTNEYMLSPKIKVVEQTSTNNYSGTVTWRLVHGAYPNGNYSVCSSKEQSYTVYGTVLDKIYFVFRNGDWVYSGGFSTISSASSSNCNTTLVPKGTSSRIIGDTTIYFTDYQIKCSGWVNQGGLSCFSHSGSILVSPNDMYLSK